MMMTAPKTPTAVRVEVEMADGTTHRVVLTDLREPFSMGLHNSPVETTFDDPDNISPFRTYKQGPEWTVVLQATGVRRFDEAAAPAVPAVEAPEADNGD